MNNGTQNASHSVELLEVATADEIERVAALGHEIWNECYSDLLSHTQIEYMLGKFQSASAVKGQISGQGYEYCIMRVDGADAGYVGVQQEDGRLLLSKLYLLAAYRGGELTNMGMKWAEDVAKKHACTHMWLTVNRHNARAVAAYKKRGFVVLREEVSDIGGGYVMDDFIMEKRMNLL